jgi:hypothetical protein
MIKVRQIEYLNLLFFIVNTDGMDILNSKKFKQNQIKDIVKPQPVVGNKEKHPTLLRGKIKKIIMKINSYSFFQILNHLRCQKNLYLKRRQMILYSINFVSMFMVHETGKFVMLKYVYSVKKEI